VPATALALLLISVLSPAQAAAPAITREGMAQFLLTARVTSHHHINKGITNPMRLTLSDGTLTHDAAFTYVDEHIPIMKFKTGVTELDFIDSYRYTLAAYRLAGLLGLDDMMPVTVERSWDGQKGALSWWLDVKWDEAARLKQKLEPPDADAWARQIYRMRVFSQLVADTDRNAGNMLISADWKLWIIDFTRAFRTSTELMNPQGLTRCDRALLARIRALTLEQVTATTKPYLPPRQIDALMARRDALVAHFARLVTERGESRVLY
jgi:hypothetical protein